MKDKAFINIIKTLIFFLMSAVLVLFDQWTKSIARMNLQNKSPIVLINNILELLYVENEGAAFGILKGKQVFFYILTIIILALILYVFIKTPVEKRMILFDIILLLIFSGAVGNFIDRLKNKYVVDFIYAKFIDFPVFNVADIYITVGSFLLVVALLTVYKNEDFIKR